MDKITREIASSLLPWAQAAKAGAIAEDPERLREFAMGEYPHIELARELLALVDKYPLEHARVSRTPRYLDGVEVAHQVLHEAAPR